MTTLDDKILGEKLQYYYSSSEDEGSDNEDGEGEGKTIRDANVNEPEIDYSADGSAVNTGDYSTHTHPLARRAEMHASHHCCCVTELKRIE